MFEHTYVSNTCVAPGQYGDREQVREIALTLRGNRRNAGGHLVGAPCPIVSGPGWALWDWAFTQVPTAFPRFGWYQVHASLEFVPEQLQGFDDATRPLGKVESRSPQSSPTLCFLLRNWGGGGCPRTGRKRDSKEPPPQAREGAVCGFVVTSPHTRSLCPLRLCLLGHNGWHFVPIKSLSCGEKGREGLEAEPGQAKC